MFISTANPTFFSQRSIAIADIIFYFTLIRILAISQAQSFTNTSCSHNLLRCQSFITISLFVKSSLSSFFKASIISFSPILQKVFQRLSVFK